MPSPPFLLFEDCRPGACAAARLFTQPHCWVIAETPAELPAAWAELRAGQQQGLWAAGFAAYELGYCLEPTLQPLLPATRAVPLLCFGLFAPPQSLNVAETAAFLAGQGEGDDSEIPFRPQWDAARYASRFRHIQGFLHSGDAYQVNLTFPFQAHTTPPQIPGLYRRLRGRQQARYSAWLHLQERDILSFSPELFFSLQGNLVTTQPMKGTAPREASPTSLQQDAKAQAENRMIVDLLRNDLSRISRIGSVKVERLFEIITLPSLHQMVSTITAGLLPGVDAWEVLQTLFPCGSVTGAPKIRAMQIIERLETAPRGVYCGSLGWVSPPGDARFNVAIRTLTAQAGGTVTAPVGGGVVLDSTLEGEYAECLLKAAFLGA